MPPQLRDRQGERDAWMRLIAVDPSNGHACHALGTMERQEGLLQAAELWFRRGCGSPGAAQGKGGCSWAGVRGCGPAPGTWCSPGCLLRMEAARRGLPAPIQLGLAPPAAADAKGALLCYEGLAELLAFKGKVRPALPA